MPATEERNRIFGPPEYYADSRSTNPGVALAIVLVDRTDIGVPLSADLATWDQIRLLIAQTEWLNYPLHAVREHTGNNVFHIVTTAESRSNQPVQDERSEFPSFKTQIATIRSALSLQMKELAEAVGVERPTMYSWIKDQNTPQPANRQRLHSIYRFAEQWNKLISTPLGKALHHVDTEGHSLFDLLRDVPIPTSTIHNRLRMMVQAAKSAPPTHSTSVRELARKHNIDLSRVGDSQDDIDLETGKRIDAD
ncbi:MAG TPA: hypothetical protein ENI62_00610 [Gammaproteobacteria bacterium]|nr:hypothetical protein [Gammaproteobacteria bacterium]